MGGRTFAEYAVFTLDELRGQSYPPARVVWQRDNGSIELDGAGRLPGPSPHDNAEYQVNEALTNLYVGLHRDLRGERLSGMRVIQVHAVDRLLTFLELAEPGASPRQDAFVVERGAERRFGAEVLPFAAIAPGYESNREAALAILEWIEQRADVNQTLAGAIRRVAAEPLTRSA